MYSRNIAVMTTSTGARRADKAGDTRRRDTNNTTLHSAHVRHYQEPDGVAESTPLFISIVKPSSLVKRFKYL